MLEPIHFLVILAPITVISTMFAFYACVTGSFKKINLELLKQEYVYRIDELELLNYDLDEKNIILEFEINQLKKQLEEISEPVIPENKFDRKDFENFVEKWDNIQFNDLGYIEKFERGVK